MNSGLGSPLLGTCAHGRQKVRIHNSRGSAKAHRVAGVRVSTKRFSLTAQRRLILMVASRRAGVLSQGQGPAMSSTHEHRSTQTNTER